jgi:hypothetical protein
MDFLHYLEEKFATGYFAIFGILLIMIDFIPLAVGLGKSKGNFQSKSNKIAFLIWFVMLVLGILLIIAP